MATPERFRTHKGDGASCKHLRRVPANNQTIHLSTIALLSLCAALYLFVAFHLGLGTYDGAPDEWMRSLVPQAIASGNLFPSGYDEEAIYDLGNWSYAFYPQMLGSYVSAAFMALAKLIGAGTSMVFVSGRFGSILLSLITLACMFLCVKTIVDKRSGGGCQGIFFGNVTIVLLGFWPQYAFISSYMNNEIVALCGASIMCCMLSIGHLDGWTIRRGLLLAIGIIVAALGYWNVYGFILAAILLFIGSVVSQRDLPRESKAKIIGFAALLSALGTLPFFALNLVRYGDVTGMSAFHSAYERWLEGGGEVLQHPYSQGLASLLLDTDYLKTTVKSFIGFFGYMTIPLSPMLYLLYATVVAAGVLAYILTARAYRGGHRVACYLAAAFSSCVTVALSLYYTLTVDYQPQGRYVICILIPLVLLVTLGFARIVRNSRLRARLCKLCCGLYCLLAWSIFLATSSANNWVGVSL